MCEGKDRQRMCAMCYTVLRVKDRQRIVRLDTPVMSFALQCVTVRRMRCSALQCVAAVREGTIHNVTHRRHKAENAERDT